MSDETGIDRAIAAAGGQVALAEKLGITQQAVSHMKRQGYTHVERAIEIEAHTGVPRSELLDPRLVEAVKDAFD